MGSNVAINPATLDSGERLPRGARPQTVSGHLDLTPQPLSKHGPGETWEIPKVCGTRHTDGAKLGSTWQGGMAGTLQRRGVGHEPLITVASLACSPGIFVGPVLPPDQGGSRSRPLVSEAPLRDSKTHCAPSVDLALRDGREQVPQTWMLLQPCFQVSSVGILLQLLHYAINRSDFTSGTWPIKARLGQADQGSLLFYVGFLPELAFIPRIAPH